LVIPQRYSQKYKDHEKIFIRWFNHHCNSRLDERNQRLVCIEINFNHI
jgi:hypothetical protein